MKFVIAFLLMLNICYANYPDYFGTGVSTTAIGNQATIDPQDAANIYYFPSLSAFAKKVSFSGSLSNVKTDFPEIKNVIKKNTATSTTTESGDVSTSYDDYQAYTVNFILPLRYENSGSLNLFVSAPIGSFVEQSSGHPEWPEYVMYRSRYKRTQFHLNYAHPFTDQFSMSIGGFLGMQASAKVETQVSLGNNFGSQGSASSKVKPSIGAVIGSTFRSGQETFNFTFQQEMKTNLESQAFGEIVDPSISLINIQINSLMYYDPHTLRFQWGHRFESSELMLGLDYQLWDNYQPPTIKVVNQGGSVKGSNDFEKLNLRNTFTPKIGSRFYLLENLTLSTGLSYRQSPIDSDFSGSGNSIDLDAIILSGGTEYSFALIGHKLTTGLALQWQKLEEKQVTKSAGLENGGAGQKIGSPGYKVGGDVLIVSVGLSVEF